MDIAITIPAYNQPHLCKLCLESIVGQQRADLPVYIFDDASQEDYSSIIHSLHNLKVYYYKNSKNLGAMQNMQNAFDNISVNYEYLMVMHEDDLLAPRFLKVVSDEFDSKQIKPKLALSYFREFTSAESISFREVSEKQPKLKWLTKKELVNVFLKYKPIAFGSAIYNTKAYPKMKLDFVHYQEFADRPFLLSSLNEDDKILLIESPLYYYRSHYPNDYRWKYLKSEHVFSLLSLYKAILNPKGGYEWNEYRKVAANFIFESYKNLRSTGKEPSWFLYLSKAFQKGLLSPKYALLKVSFINRFFTSIKKSFLFV